MNFFLRFSRHPEIVVAISAAIWGLFWIPFRAFENAGLNPSGVTLSQFVAPLVVLIPFAAIRFFRNRPVGFGQYKTGLFISAAFALYCESLLLTDVVRALILFYVMPAWGTLAEIGLMGRRFTLRRGLALFLSLFGMAVILGIDESVSLQMNAGDIMALAAGILFTIGAMRVRQSGEVSAFEQTFAFFLYGSFVSLGLALLPIHAVSEPPTLAFLVDLMPWFFLMAAGFLIPVMWGLYWGSRHVDPGRLGILLQLEAVVGIGSAAILAGEPFGPREFSGAVLVISAGAVEVFGKTSVKQGDHDFQ